MQNHLLEMDAKKAAQPTWETVRYMISAIQYGGRITDDFDQLLMDTYAEKYFHPVRHLGTLSSDRCHLVDWADCCLWASLAEFGRYSTA